MNDSSNILLGAANHNFGSAASTRTESDQLNLISLGLKQVANAVANQVSDPGLAQAASNNFGAVDALSNSSTDSLALMGTGLGQLATALQALS